MARCTPSAIKFYAPGEAETPEIAAHAGGACQQRTGMTLGGFVLGAGRPRPS
jgi:hypothetical protein